MDTTSSVWDEDVAVGLTISDDSRRFDDGTMVDFLGSMNHFISLITSTALKQATVSQDAKQTGHIRRSWRHQEKNTRAKGGLTTQESGVKGPLPASPPAAPSCGELQ
jgi:hypothetical protein